MDLIFGRFGGHAMFDPYSLQHIVWFFAITVALASLRFRNLWIWVICLAGFWEVIEWWITDNIADFPFVGREDMINKAVGDPISDLAGFFLGLAAIRAVYAVMGKRRLGDFPELLEKAKTVAEKAHMGQRYGKFPYTHHLFGTWDVLTKFGFSESDPNKTKRERSQRLILGAILHDTLEDTDITYDDLQSGFGKEIADLVFAVTNEPGKNRAEKFMKTYPKIRSHPDAIILKLADRIANVIHALQFNHDILNMYRNEWIEFKRNLYVSGEHDLMWEHLESILVKTNRCINLPNGRECFWPIGEKIQFGTRVRTTVDSGLSDWTSEGKLARKWNVEGIVSDRSDSHGLCYMVKYMDGSCGWFDPSELKII